MHGRCVCVEAELDELSDWGDSGDPGESAALRDWWSCRRGPNVEGPCVGVSDIEGAKGSGRGVEDV